MICIFDSLYHENRAENFLARDRRICWDVNKNGRFHEGTIWKPWNIGRCTTGNDPSTISYGTLNPTEQFVPMAQRCHTPKLGCFIERITNSHCFRMFNDAIHHLVKHGVFD